LGGGHGTAGKLNSGAMLLQLLPAATQAIGAASVSNLDPLPAWLIRPNSGRGLPRRLLRSSSSKSRRRPWRGWRFVGLFILLAAGVVSVTLWLGPNIGSYKTTSSSTFTRPDGAATVDESEDIFCRYLTLRGIKTRSLSGRDMVCPCACPLFDPGRRRRFIIPAPA